MKNKENARIRRGLKAKAIQRRNPEKPRLVVHRSSSHIYCQIVVRDANGDKVVVCSSTLDKELKSSLSGTKVEQAHQVGKLLGERAKASKIIEVSFDRAGYRYHGRVKALADGAREAGLNF
ncbi:50S ribosomal protein L18 [Legionella jordanis]|uniref:Large ribosomal subunit protein uL18 n=1 Tax=Legionella jordanis TaxID=456 RepID=A0A0W0VCM3_9GAMM|nr:50S ribosomal protein L18 [Legionella jordanis]KTD17629.1 50S ribosomal protein L18 [Legionella jordanis]RMX00911.1 50S ribosomal protein L18 [Legionella jordanis]RMX17876.1 50S ribosomal protein L18 [Legionella jordanis]VEH11449.1 50S ribosomal protein L18 [Legionella jordanis]HAT8714935.1 50S ribosomal protein L18 [Legionella jordanis]